MAVTQKLNQVLAIEKSIGTVKERAITDAYHQLQKPDLFEGFSRNYQPFNAEDTDKLPPEKQVVRQNVTGCLKTIRVAMTELIDIIATKDNANCEAKADIQVGVEILAPNVPGVTLLRLEKFLTDMRTAIAAAPVLDPAEEWKEDAAAALYKSEPKRTVRTKKIAKVITKAPATDKHPAQAEIVYEDASVGEYFYQRVSGALTAPAKERLLERLETLQKAVKYAREQANVQEAPDVKIGHRIFAYLFE